MDLRSLLSLPVLQHSILPDAAAMAAHTSVPESLCLPHSTRAHPLLPRETSGQTSARSSAEQ